jgi:hypothetical protein
MVDVAVKYRVEVDKMVMDKALRLREHKLGKEEWALMDVLIKILKVCVVGVEYKQPCLYSFGVS